MDFISSFFPQTELSGSAWWFIFKKDQILVQVASDGTRIPVIKNPESLHIAPVRIHYLGVLDDLACYAAEIDATQAEIPRGTTFLSLRALFGSVADELFRIAVRASMILYWDRTHQFCGQCGVSTRLSTVERAKVCPACGMTTYPHISPAVIVAVIKERRLLLARAIRYAKNLYSVLAGFVEPGETFEESVIREVKEEVGIDVKNIRYFGSQPWPFPDSLMVAFVADCAGGDIKVDGKEIADAGWFTADNLPEIPGKISIARRMIDWFSETFG
jgi:NAD+ diphosphatase